MPLVRKSAAGPADPPPTDIAATLTSGDAEARWNAARRLGENHGSAAILGSALSIETDARVREAIFTSLARLGTPASVDAVLPFLRDRDAQLRSGALDALRAMIGAVRSRLPALLADRDVGIRLQVCDLTRDIPSPEASGLLAALLDRETETNVCAAAVDVLAEIGDSTALPALARCAARFAGDPFLIFALGIATERIIAQRPDRDE